MPGAVVVLVNVVVLVRRAEELLVVIGQRVRQISGQHRTDGEAVKIAGRSDLQPRVLGVQKPKKRKCNFVIVLSGITDLIQIM